MPYTIATRTTTGRAVANITLPETLSKAQAIELQTQVQQLLDAVAWGYTAYLKSDDTAKYYRNASNVVATWLCFRETWDGPVVEGSLPLDDSPEGESILERVLDYLNEQADKYKVPKIHGEGRS